MTPLELLYLAVESKIGIVISVEHFDRARAKLYAERKKSGDPLFDHLEIRRSPVNPENEIWIVKGKAS